MGLLDQILVMNSSIVVRQVPVQFKARAAAGKNWTVPIPGSLSRGGDFAAALHSILGPTALHAFF